MISTTIPEFISKFFNSLNTNDITYCVLRNFDDLPNSVGNDVDIWVSRSDENKFRNLLYKTAHNSGWEIIRYAPWLSNNGQGRYFFIRDVSNIVVLHYDCYVHLHWRGMTYIEENELETSISLHDKGFYIASPGVEASTMLFPRLLGGGIIRERDKKRIKECLNNYDSFICAVGKPFGGVYPNAIIDLVMADDWIGLKGLKNQLRFVLLKKAINLKFLTQLSRWKNYISSRIKEHLFQDYGLFVALIGPDGSGKTTIANSIINSSLVRNIFESHEYLHGRFSYLPELKTIKNMFLNNRMNDRTTDIQNTKFSSREIPIISSMFYPLYYSIDFILGYFRIRKIRAYYGIAVFDRYFYDYWIQKRHNNCPRWFLSFLGSLIPKPDVTVYLEARPEEIYRRKQDLPLDEIERQVEVCQGLIEILPNGHRVDASRAVEDVVTQIEDIILDKVRTKWERSREYRLFLEVEDPVLEPVTYD
jgi:thymidylate kinase